MNRLDPPAGTQPDAWVALGSDPFEEVVEVDPFLEGLAAMGLEPLPMAAPEAAARVLDPEITPATRTGPGPLRARRRNRWPRVGELESPSPESWVDRWLDDDARRRLVALSHLVEGEGSYDRYGFSPEVARLAFPLFQAIHRYYFRVRRTGVENLPSEGAAVLASNHGGLLPFDGAMIVMDVLLHSDPPRLPRAIVDRWAGRLPWINVFYARVGQIIGTRENFADLLADDQWVLVFPEGTAGIRKTLAQRHRIQPFRVGFVEQALQAGVPIVPIAVIGSDDQSPILHDFQSLAQRLGLPALPITPTFPWLGPLGLLPYPVPYHIVYGEPLRFHERFGPEDAADARLVAYLARQVRREVQHLLDRHL